MRKKLIAVLLAATMAVQPVSAVGAESLEERITALEQRVAELEAMVGVQSKKDDKVDSSDDLTDYEEAALAVAKDTQDNLKSKKSFEIYSIKVKSDDDFIVLMEYSATNSYGASIDDTVCRKVRKATYDVVYAETFAGVMDNETAYKEMIKAYNASTEEEIK